MPLFVKPPASRVLVALALMVPEFATPPPIVLPVTKTAFISPRLSTPGVIVPAFVTAPVTVEPLITIEVVAEAGEIS